MPSSFVVKDGGPDQEQASIQVECLGESGGAYRGGSPLRLTESPTIDRFSPPRSTSDQNSPPGAIVCARRPAQAHADPVPADGAEENADVEYHALPTAAAGENRRLARTPTRLVLPGRPHSLRSRSVRGFPPPDAA